ncbi:MAG: chitinase [Lachnospiraceae bacterium]|nr:chitinase [Lachnospiraceae bacterium]
MDRSDRNKNQAWEGQDPEYYEEYPEAYEEYPETYEEYYGEYPEEVPQERPARRASAPRRSAARSRRPESTDERPKKSRRKKRRRRQEKANTDVIRRFIQSLLAIGVALLLIVIIFLVAFGGRIKESIANHEEINGRWFLSLLYPEKYSYGTAYADMKEYFQLFSEDDVAIILQDERIAAHAKYIDKTVYFSLDTIRELFTRRFYVNDDEGVLLYSTSEQVIKNVIGESKYSKDGQETDLGCTIARYGKDGTFYIAADYVKLFADFDYSFYTDEEHSNRVQVYTKWEEDRVAVMKNATMLRIKGGIKSDVLREVKKDEEVEILETMETWSKVKTSDAFIGFVENKTLGEAQSRTLPAVTGAYKPEADYGTTPPMERVLLGWHQIFDSDAGWGMEEITANAVGMNVVSPTWFFLVSEDGQFRTTASRSYTDRAHAKGYKVWALVENMEADFDETALFSSSSRRADLIDSLINAAGEYGFDGINMDVELTDAKLSECGSHYVQFLRELAIACRARGLVLSVDVPVPTESNKSWDFEELGIVCDYVVIMAYDEHYAGSDAGSVASLAFVEKGLDDVLTKYHVPAARVVCGLPFYTRLWLTEGSSVNSDAVGMDTAKQWVDNHSLEPLWQDDAGQYYVELKDGTGTYQMWLEDESSIEAKLSAIQERGVHSIAGWKLGLEKNGIWSLIDSKLQ